ncbi:T3SS effector HopA1 family protein [Nannocystaceae bacterium ST9]
MTDHMDSLALFERIASEVWLTDADRFVHATTAAHEGRMALLARPDDAPELLPETPRPPIPVGLTHFLYAQYYLQDPNEVENGRTNALSKIPICAREDAELGRALREANRGSGYLEPGWTVVGHEDDATLAHKAGVTLVCREDDIAEPGPHRVGASIALRFPNERPYTYPGFFTAIGDGGPTTPDEGRAIVRVYFDVAPTMAAALVSALTGTLGRSLSRFTLKVLNNPRWYTRPDAAVAYLLRDEYPRAHAVVGEIVRSFGERLGDRTPTLARRLAPGVAVAEEPIIEGSNRASFGFHRCGLIAEGLARAHSAGVRTAAGRSACILRAYQDAGLDPARPWLNPGSPDFHPLDWQGMTCD